ncbi:hypothetical protein MKR81_07060 [Vibrio campbellii]|uniref:GNAT family N-acetyltransferase n=1 Tax=Vibrio campbellii TaxID=680 RepID=UPI001F0717D0|nr:GNAT family N-acetyltransferase [Vibrio campbellii]UMM04345.1 hypothetical protein MKR81_07060 [Vibrio campbellii]
MYEIIENPDKWMIEAIQSRLDVDYQVGISDIYSNFECQYYIVLSDNQPIAIATTHGPLSYLELYKLYVIPEYRYKRVADDLFAYIFNKLKAKTSGKIVIEITEQSAGFWSKVLRNYNYIQISGQLKLEVSF